MNKSVIHFKLLGIVIVFYQLVTVPVYGEIRVEDYLQRTVALEQPATRIIALAPNIVENLATVGAIDTIVGTVESSDFPPQARAIARVGKISTFSIENIVNLNPDLVILWHSGRSVEILEKLVAVGLTVYASDPRRLSDIAKSIRDYGVLTGNEYLASARADEFIQQLAELRNRYGAQRPLRVMYQIWNNPLQTLNNEHVISEVISLCGGVNVFGDAPSLAPRISIESVLATDPEVIIASGSDSSEPPWLHDWQRWPAIAAVSTNNLFFIPPDFIQRPTLRLLQGATTLCEQLQIARQKYE